MWSQLYPIYKKQNICLELLLDQRADSQRQFFLSGSFLIDLTFIDGFQFNLKTQDHYILFKYPTYIPVIINKTESSDNMLQLLQRNKDENKILKVLDAKQKKLLQFQNFYQDSKSKYTRQLDLSQQAKREAEIPSAEDEIRATLSDQAMIFQLYLEYGPSWKLITKKIQNKRKSPKNIVYNAIRRVTEILVKFQSTSEKRIKRCISKHIILSLLQVSNQIQDRVKRERLTLRRDSQIFRFKYEIVRFCSSPNITDESQIDGLIKLLKSLSTAFKCFGIFKTKNRRSWKLSQRLFNILISKGNIIEESIEINQKYQIEISNYDQQIECQESESQDLQIQSLKQSQIVCHENKQASLMDEFYNIISWPYPQINEHFERFY